MRSFLVLILAGALGFLVACSSGGTPVGVTATVALSPSTAFVNAGGTLNIVANVSGDPSGKGVSWSLSGVGNLTKKTGTSVTYNAPLQVSSTSIATVVATSAANSTVSASLPMGVLAPGPTVNVVPIAVNGGLLAATNMPYLNAAFTSVRICPPSGACQTVDNILVDTGSFGLRVLGSAVSGLVPLNDGNGNTLYNCVQFLDNSFLWGAVAPANILLGGEVQFSTSVQVIATPSFSIPSGCSGINEDTPALLGANGILGIGPEPFDCGLNCDASVGGTPPTNYYLCSSGGSCNTTFVSCGALCQDTLPNQQVTNPVFNFQADNNGVVVELPAVNDVAATLNGSLIFGIGTQTNNALPGTATVFTLNSEDFFTTNFNSQSLTSSFIDSGSNGLFFPDSSLAICAAPNASWYCQAAANLSATNVDPNNGSTTNTVIFSIDDFDTVTAANPSDAAFGNLGGPLTGQFDWGLPFFYGRKVFTAIDGTATPTGTTAPFWAY